MSSYHLLEKKAGYEGSVGQTFFNAGRAKYMNAGWGGTPPANPYGGLGQGSGTFQMPRGGASMTGEQLRRATGTGGFTNNRGPAPNPYLNVSPAPAIGAPEWQSAPGLKAPTTPGLGQRLWQSKGEIAGNLGGWSAGAAAGAAIGAPFGGIGAIPGAMIGSVIGGLAGSTLGGWGGEQADNAMNAQAAKGQLYRPPVTDMASYGANMLAQGIDENRKRTSQ